MNHHHKLDVSSEPPQRPSREENASSPVFSPRPFVGVEFACCGKYARVYRNREETHYVGNCPKCAKPIRLKIGPGGSDSRFFTAY